MVLAEEVRVDHLAHNEESQAGKEDRQEDADYGLREGGAMEGYPLLKGEWCLHGSLHDQPLKGIGTYRDQSREGEVEVHDGVEGEADNAC